MLFFLKFIPSLRLDIRSRRHCCCWWLLRRVLLLLECLQLYYHRHPHLGNHLEEKIINLIILCALKFSRPLRYQHTLFWYNAKGLRYSHLIPEVKIWSQDLITYFNMCVLFSWIIIILFFVVIIFIGLILIFFFFTDGILLIFWF